MQTASKTLGQLWDKTCRTASDAKGRRRRPKASKTQVRWSMVIQSRPPSTSPARLKAPCSATELTAPRPSVPEARRAEAYPGPAPTGGTA